MMTRRERGFVLLAVLWVIVGVTAVSLGMALLARGAAGAARNRQAATVAMWQAEDCASRAESVIGAALGSRRGDSAATADVLHRWWSNLDEAVSASAEFVDAPCTLSLRPTGTTIDINTATDSMLSRLFVALGDTPPTADSLADAILDWRDADDVPRLTGAESAWYRAQRREAPRNAPFADVRELSLVRGFERVANLDSVFGVQQDRLVLDRAPLAVIAALPGFTDEALAHVAEFRARGTQIPDLLSLGSQLSPAGRAALLAAYPDLLRMTTSEPDAWILTVRGAAGVPAVTVVVELRLVRAGDRAAIMRRRTWIQ